MLFLCILLTGASIGELYHENGEEAAAQSTLEDLRKPLPAALMAGRADVLQIDKAVVESDRGSSNETLLVKGAIALRSGPANLVSEEVVITLDTQVFTIPAGSFRSQKNAFVCKKAEIVEGGVVTARFDFTKCTFLLVITETDIHTELGIVDFSISFGPFNEVAVVEVKTQDIYLYINKKRVRVEAQNSLVRIGN